MPTPREPLTVPVGRTARRLDWLHLPPAVRSYVEQRCGSAVVDATTQTAGYTPGVATVLTCADGTRLFLKAASRTAQPASAAAYAEEARRLAALPPGVPAPRLRWTGTAADWVVLGIEHAAARAPARPWRDDDLERCLGLTATVAEALTPPPAAMDLDSFADDHRDDLAAWGHVRATRPGFPHLEEAAALAAAATSATAGGTLVHTDLRDDNLLLCDDGRTLACDWNWPSRGAPWIDTVLLLLGPRGDGLDAEGALATHPLTRDVAPEDVDALLALLLGGFMRSSDLRVPTTSPWIREHQAWCARVAWGWLAERRGWDAR